MSEKIKALKIIHLGICCASIITYCVIGYLYIGRLNITNIPADSLIYIALPVLALIISNVIFNIINRNAKAGMTIDESFAIYQSASITRWAILEGTAFLILFLIPEIVLFGIIIICYLVFLRPGEDNFQKELQRFD